MQIETTVRGGERGECFLAHRVLRQALKSSRRPHDRANAVFADEVDLAVGDEEIKGDATGRDSFRGQRSLDLCLIDGPILHRDRQRSRRQRLSERHFPHALRLEFELGRQVRSGGMPIDGDVGHDAKTFQIETTIVVVHADQKAS